MLYWVVLAVVIILGVAAYFLLDTYSDCAQFFGMICAFVSVVCAVVFIIMSLFVIGENLYADATKAACQQRYDSIVYQLENDVYENDNDLGKRELMVDVQEWNEDLAINKAKQRDFWVGIFTPNIYDEFEFIELT